MAEYTLDSTIAKLIDEAINHELSAQYFYTSAYSFCSQKQYVGGMKFFNEEAKSEKKHANGLIDYATDWGYQPKLSDVLSPDKFSSLKNILDKACGIEYELLDFYKAAYKKAMDIAPNVAVALFAKYVQIQDDSVREYQNLIGQYNVYGDSLVALFDKEVLGA